MTKVGNSLILWVILSLPAVFSSSFPAYGKYGGGTGEPDDPYLIYTAEQMNAIGTDPNDWDKHFKLMADIDLGSFTGTSYNIIGGEWDNPFTGVFDGNNKKISNFNYSSIGRDKVGIFSYIYNPNAEVKDLGLIDPIIDAREGDTVGSLVGFLRNGAIINCYAQGGSVSGYDGVGGLVGLSFESTITNCYTSTSVSGNKDVGGLTGNAGKITNCYTTGDVSGYENVGGLAGRSYETIISCYSMSNISGQESVGGLVGTNMWGKITNCYSSASATGIHFVGGLVGANMVGKISNCYSSAFATGTYYVGGLVGDGGSGTITNCYSSTSAKGVDSVGGLVGTNQWGTITNCYSIGQVEGLSNVGGLVGYFAGNISASFWDTLTSRQAISAGGTDLITTEMQLESTFTNVGWDFVGERANGTDDIWSICEGVDYPKLAWQSIIGDLNYDSRINFTDFAIFAGYWHGTGSSFFCGGTDFTNDNIVDFVDLKELADNWLIDGTWNLSVPDFIIVDDFEHYNSGDNRIWYAWHDGAGYVVEAPPPPSYGGNGSGSAVGNENTASFTEETIVHGGNQSMPFAYDNTGSNGKACYSQAERTWNTPQDWTRYRVKALTLWFHGDPGNAAEQLYMAVQDSAGKTKLVNYQNSNAVLLGAWLEWKIDMKEFSNAGVNLRAVKKMHIGIGDRVDPKPGGIGILYVDDIRLYRAG